MPSCPRDVPPGPVHSLRNELVNTGPSRPGNASACRDSCAVGCRTLNAAGPYPLTTLFIEGSQKRKLLWGCPAMPGEPLVGSASLTVAGLPGPGGGVRAPNFSGLLSRIGGCAGQHVPVACDAALTLVRPSSRLGRRSRQRWGTVQQKSTATHPDAGGRAGTREDGDLHGWTRVDVLPPDGMQEVSGSSPLSSTGQKRNSNGSNIEYSRKVQQRRPGGPPYVCSDQIFPGLGAAGPTSVSRC